jgi:hypothetical protein
MKKTVSLMGLALMSMVALGGFTACSQDDDIVTNATPASPSSTLIGFNGTADNAAGTRALPIGSANFNDQVKNFKVWGYLTNGGAYYLGRTGDAGILINNMGGGKWDYNTATDMVYWPNEAMNFYAVTPSTNSNYSFNGGLLTYTVPTDNSAQVDLMTAKANNQTKMTNKGVVNLQFQHALSQVVFKGMTKSSSLSVEVQSITIHNLNSVMTIDLNGAATKPTAKYANYGIGMSSTKTVAVTDASKAVNLTAANGAMMLVPQTLTAWTNNTTTAQADAANQAYIEISCKITSKTSAGVAYLVGTATAYDKCYVPLSGTWEAGKRYVYTLQFGGGKDESGNDRFAPITFSVSVSDWSDSSSSIAM